MPKARPITNLKPKKTLRIFCEGEKTEPNYIKAYLDTYKGNQRAAVVEIEPTVKNTPVQLVKEALKLQASNRHIPGDEIWVVYDREGIVKYSKKLHEEAWNDAAKAGIEIAISNVCFEHWILLHFIESTAAYTNFDDLLHRSSLNASVSAACGFSYSKSSRKLNAHLMGLVKVAKERALRVNEEIIKSSFKGARPFEMNPFTDIPTLLQAIDDFK